MASRPLVLLVLLLLGGAALALAVRDRGRRRLLPGAARTPGVEALRRASLLSRALALVVGVAVAALVAGLDPLGRGLALAPCVVAAVLLAGVVLAESATRDAVRRPGRAGLDTRRLRDLAPPAALGRSVVAATVALVAGGAWATVVASPDDLGRAGRSLATTCGPGCSGSRGPWPGSFYTVPLAVGLLVVLVLAVVAARAVVRRPRNGADPDVVRVDDVARRRALETVVAAVGLAVGGTLAGAGLPAAGALLASGVAAAGGAVVVLALLGLALAVWSLAVLVLPGTGRLRAARTIPEGPGPALSGTSS